VQSGGEWREWWRASSAPTRWPAALSVVEHAVVWRQLAPGLDWGELHLAGSGEAWRLRVIVARLDPRRFALAIHANVDTSGMAGPWSVDVAPVGAVVAANAGQFDGSGPWGWVVHQGVEIRPPGAGPLAPAFVVNSTGGVRLVPPDSIAVLRSAGGVVEAFQSYPMLLTGDGEIPHQLARAGRGVDLRHRDSRLALGILRDGRVLLALTRFETLGGALERLPFGPTVPEMAAVMGAMGCQSAVLLDGGISGQLLLRDRAGRTREWRGMRGVPLGLIAMPRPISNNRP
jgi:exopolysaccharide biosynthesis protein